MWLIAYMTELDVVMILAFFFAMNGRMLMVRRRVEKAFWRSQHEQDT